MVAATKPKTIQKAVKIAITLTDEALRNGSITKNPQKRGNGGEPSKDRNVRDDNKRTRTGNAFDTTTNSVGRENMGMVPKCTICNTYHPPEVPCSTCFNCNRPGHFAKDCRVMPRNVNPVNARNPAAARGACYECGRSWKPRELGKRKGIHVGSRGGLPGPEHRDGFDLIIGMDWLSDHKVEIICHEKVVRITLLDGKVLRVLGEKPEEKVRHSMSAKAKEQKQEEIVVVRDFPEVFLDDLSVLTLVREIEFRIELVLGAIPVAMSPYRLEPSELEELSGQLKEL
ncbi:putative reverse transcriptase domain-containing protein [Tanacetum coccineum]